MFGRNFDSFEFVAIALHTSTTLLALHIQNNVHHSSTTNTFKEICRIHEQSQKFYKGVFGLSKIMVVKKLFLVDTT